MSQYILTDSLTIETITCGECGIVWGMPQSFLEERRRDGNVFYCPNGHGRAYKKTELGKLREEVERKGKMLTEAWRVQSNLRNQRDSALKQQRRFATLYKKIRQKSC